MGVRSPRTCSGSMNIAGSRLLMSLKSKDISGVRSAITYLTDINEAWKQIGKTSPLVNQRPKQNRSVKMKAASSKEDFIEQFQVMNGLIESAILRQDFDHVVEIDQKRRQLIQDFAAVTQPSEDKVFFEALEACAEGNARAISKMKSEMANFAKQSNRKTKAISGYRR